MHTRSAQDDIAFCGKAGSGTHGFAQVPGAGSGLVLPYSFRSGLELLVELGEVLGLGQDGVGQRLEEHAFGDGGPAGTMDDLDELVVEVVSRKAGDRLPYGAELLGESVNVSGRYGLGLCKCCHAISLLGAVEGLHAWLSSARAGEFVSGEAPFVSPALLDGRYSMPPASSGRG